MMKFQILSQNCILDTYEGNETTLDLLDYQQRFLKCDDFFEMLTL